MTETIEASAELYRRLSDLAVGFDSPEAVIERLLSAYESQKGGSVARADDQSGPLTRPEPIFYPVDDAEDFRLRLIEAPLAYRRFTYSDGTTKLRTWKCIDFTEESDLAQNINTGPLRSWRTKGIVKLELAINQQDLAPTDEELVMLKKNVEEYRDNQYVIVREPKLVDHNADSFDKLKALAATKEGGVMGFDEMCEAVKDHQHGTKTASHPYQFIIYLLKFSPEVLVPVK